jgi:putative acetyltransferase
MDIQVRAFDLPRDLDGVVELHGQPRCIAGTLQLPYRDPEDIRARWREPPPGMHRLVACVDDGGRQRIVGILGLQRLKGRRDHVGELGMMVHDDVQSQGVGMALMQAALGLADRWLGLTRLELTVYVDNARALRLYERCGFTVEGTHREYALRDGEYVDAHAMARLRPRGDDARDEASRARGRA